MSENKSDINAGDIVQLRHGGPIMTVTKVAMPAFDSKMNAWCAWSDAHGKILNGTFPLEALHKPSKAIIRSHAFKSWFSMILGAIAKRS